MSAKPQPTYLLTLDECATLITSAAIGVLGDALSKPMNADARAAKIRDAIPRVKLGRVMGFADIVQGFRDHNPIRKAHASTPRSCSPAKRRRRRSRARGSRVPSEHVSDR